MVRLLTLNEIRRSITALVALCAKHTIRRRGRAHSEKLGNEVQSNNSRIALRSSKKSSKQFFATISSKAFPFIYKKKTSDQYVNNYDIHDEYEGSFGDGGLWQRGIIMGEKCEPHDFSGVIYYDVDGKQLSQIPPKSPRASPLPSNFSFPVARDGNF